MEEFETGTQMKIRIERRSEKMLKEVDEQRKMLGVSNLPFCFHTDGNFFRKEDNEGV